MLKYMVIPLLIMQPLMVQPAELDLYSYPSQWNKFSIEEMFKLPEEKAFSEKFLKQWMNAMEACYKGFKKDAKSSGYNFSRTIDSFKGVEYNYKEKTISIVASHSSAIKKQTTWISNWFLQTYPFLENFNARSLGATIHSLSYLRVKPEKKWMTAFLTQAQNELFNFKNEPQGCSIVLCSMASLGIIAPNKTLIDSFLAAALSKSGGLNAQEISNILYALALLGHVPNQDNLDELQKLVDNIDYYKIEAKHQIFLFLQHLKKQKISFLKDELLKSWVPEIKKYITQANNVSQAEQDVCMELRKVNKNFSQSVYIPEVASIVDFYDSATKTILQFDGPFHFLSDGTYDGSSVFQERLLKEFGYKVKRLSYKAWQKSDNKKALLKSLLTE